MFSDRPSKSTYILVASRTSATLFASHGPHEPMDVVEQIDHPRGRLQSNEIDSDRPGRSFDRSGMGRHSLVGEESAREHIEHEFAHQLGELLDQRRCAGEYDRLILIAGPKLLGHLRKELSAPTRQLLTTELHKELIEPTEAMLREHLAGLAKV